MLSKPATEKYIQDGDDNDDEEEDYNNDDDDDDDQIIIYSFDDINDYEIILMNRPVGSMMGASLQIRSQQKPGGGP